MPAQGRIVQIMGPVLDVQFPPDQLPDIYNAIEIPLTPATAEVNESATTAAWQSAPTRLIAEVQQHLGNDWVRCVALGATEGLRRGMPAIDQGGPISVPVGPLTLGRIFNVLGQTIDGKPELAADSPHYSIHRPAPSLAEQSTEAQIFETGLKVIDLIAP